MLNKAVYGGLNGIYVAPRASYDQYVREADLSARLDALVRKINLISAPTPGQIAAVQRAQQYTTWLTVTAAERRLAGTPIVIVGPYLQTLSSCAVSIILGDGCTVQGVGLVGRRL